MKDLNCNHFILFKKISYPTSKKDDMTIELRSQDERHNPFLLGVCTFSPASLKTQEEYDLELLIPDEYDEHVTAANIKAKVRFFWSNCQFYLEKTAVSDNEINKLQLRLNQTYEYLKKLNGKDFN